MTGREDVRYHLVDAYQRQFGEFVLERNENKLLCGRFAPGPAFADVEPLFREFEEAVNCQALPKIDRLDTAIEALGLHLRSADSSHQLAIKDVQIWSDGGITCRLLDQAFAEVNGSPASAPAQVSKP
jgi:hypothetical protein